MDILEIIQNTNTKIKPGERITKHMFDFDEVEAIVRKAVGLALISEPSKNPDMKEIIRLFDLAIYNAREIGRIENKIERKLIRR